MLSRLMAALGLGGGERAGAGAEVTAPPVEYKGFRIRPAPFKTGNHFQTAGVIEKDFPDGTKQHRFIRADAYASQDDASAFAVSKAQQIIDLEGDRIFR